MSSKNAGSEGFVWFSGKVEDILDPEMMGRIKVRIVNYHADDPNVLPTSHLAWASVIQPIYSAALNGIGTSPTGIQIGSTVFGFFVDGDDAQLPVIFGTLAAKKDISPLAIGIDTLQLNTTIGPEPQSAFAAVYPFNQVFVTASGISVEYDNTPGHTRIRTIHPSGTYTEINEVGRTVVKNIDDFIEVNVGNKTVHVGGVETINVLGDSNILIEEDSNLTIGGHGYVTIKGNVKVLIDGDMDATVTGNTSLFTRNLNIATVEDIRINAGHDVDIIAGHNINHTAGNEINNNPPDSDD